MGELQLEYRCNNTLVTVENIPMLLLSRVLMQVDPQIAYEDISSPKILTA